MDVMDMHVLCNNLIISVINTGFPLSYINQCGIFEMNASILQPFPIPAIVEEVISNSTNLYIYNICNNHKGKNLYYDMPLYTQINVKSVDLIPAKIISYHKAYL